MIDRSWLSRTELLIGNQSVEVLANSHVLVVGLGGVGSFAAEFLVRAGVGSLTIADGDVVEASNRNRQLPAMISTIGKYKVQIMKERLLDINSDLKIRAIQEFIQPDAAEELFDYTYDYVVEAIDSITPKLMVLKNAYEKKLNIVSSMGAGGKLDPTCLKVTDLLDTYQCPFAQTVRKRIKSLGVGRGIKAVFSNEEIIKESLIMTDGTRFKKSAYGTISYLPATFGAVCASVVVRDLIDEHLSA